MVLTDNPIFPIAKRIMDTADLSDLEIENTVIDNIRKNSSGLVRNGGLVPRGTCYNPDCEEAVADKKLFCNGDCATEHHKASKRFKR